MERNEQWILRPMTILNRRCFDGKNEQERYLLEVLIPFTDDEVKRGCLGHAIKQIYMSREQWLKFDEKCIDRIVEFSYGANDFGSAEITGWKFVDYLHRKE